MSDYQDTWKRCPIGEIDRMVEGLQHNQRRQVLRQFFIASGGVLSLVLVVALTVIVWQAPKKELSCRQVVGMLEEFHRNSLDSPMMQQIANHLGHCKSCSRKYDQLRQQSQADLRPAEVARVGPVVRVSFARAPVFDHWD